MKCPYCGFENNDTAFFCANCGNSLTLTASAAPADTASAAPGNDGFTPYTPADGTQTQSTENSAGYSPMGGTQSTQQNTSYNSYTPYAYSVPAPRVGDSSKNGLAITGFIAALLSLICCVFSMFWFPIIFALLGLIFGILGLKSTHRGLSIAAIIIASIGLVMGLLFLVAFMAGGGYEAFLEEFNNAFDSVYDNL